MAVDLEKAVTEEADSKEHQPEAPGSEARESTLDPARLTWMREIQRRYERQGEELAAEAARMVKR
jgi:hypothetical protein